MSHEIFDGEIEVDESYFGGKRKGKRGCGAAGSVPVFGLLKRGEWSTRRLSSMLPQRRYTPSLSAKSCLTVLFVLIAGEDITSWMYLTSNTSVSIIPSFLQTIEITSTA